MQTHTIKWAYIKDKGAFTVIGKKLHFLDCVSKQWEEFDIESFWEDHFTRHEKKYIKSELGFEPKRISK